MVALREKPDDVCRYVWLARERQRRDLKEAPKRGLFFDRKAGERVVQFLETYVYHWQGPLAGQRLVLGECQREDLIIPLFGWRREKDGTRRFRVAYWELPRKWGKTFLAGGIGNYMTLADHEPGAEVYSVATKREQARKCWKDAKNSIDASPGLKRYLKPFHTSIVCDRTKSTFQPLSSESGTQDGLNTHCGICDELHEWKDKDLLDKIRTSMGARRQPLLLEITTAGVYDPESVAWKQHLHAQQVLEGARDDDSFFAFIASADEGDDPSDPATWRKAHLNLGVTVEEQFLAEEWNRYSQEGSVNTFLRYYLNIWPRQLKRALAPDDWNVCAEKPPEFEGPCFVGLYVGSETDLNARVAYFPETNSVDCRFWCPEETVRERERREIYGEWADDDWIVATPGESIASSFIVKDVQNLCSRYQVIQINTDRTNAHDIIEKLEEPGVPVARIAPTVTMLNAATKEFLKLVRGRELQVGVNPPLRWMANNLAVYENGDGDKRPDKKRSGDNISGISALVMAMDGALRNQAETGDYSDPALFYA